MGADWGRFRKILQWCLIDGVDDSDNPKDNFHLGRGQAAAGVISGDAAAIVAGVEKMVEDHDEPSSVCASECLSENPPAVVGMAREVAGYQTKAIWVVRDGRPEPVKPEPKR